MRSECQDILRWLHDIERHINMANRFAEGMDRTTFMVDELRVYGVTRCLEIISEASRRLPDALKDRHPVIAWRQMAAAGNIYRHEYEDVAARSVWDTLTYHLPPLLAVIRHEISAIGPDALPVG